MLKPIILALGLLASASLFALDVERDIIQRSRQYIGCAYVRGGVNPPQFDCSGFVGYIIRPFVPGLPRLSGDMAQSGVKIAKADLAPGDLVFFATTATPGAVSHVALYIGNGSIIHAISDGPDRGVNITPLDSRYWKQHYHSAVRVLPAGSQGSAARESHRTERPLQFAKGSYTGDIRSGEPEGQGILRLNNGDLYSGAFVGGKFEGRGLYRWLDGSSYEGQFKADAFHGQGILTDAKGVKRPVVYENGVLKPADVESAPATESAPAAEKTPATESAPAAPRPNYLQVADSPWDKWTGYISGDYDQWKAQQHKDFEKSKKAFDKEKESKEFEEWKKTQG